MARIGYARESSVGQTLTAQLEQLRASGCDKIFFEPRGPVGSRSRKELFRTLDWVSEGDVFVVTRLDRLARSLTELGMMVSQLAAKQVGLLVLQQDAIDTTGEDSWRVLRMIEGFTAFEADLRRERQASGIAKARQAGVYRGRPPSIAIDDVKRLRSEGKGATEIARELKIGRASVYRLLAHD